MKKRILPLELFFSTIIIFSIIFIITIICLEIKNYSHKISKKTEASIIATNILENIKSRHYDDVEKYIEELSYVGISKKIENNIQYITVNGREFSEKFFGTQVPDDYVIDFQMENIEEGFNVQKEVLINLNYNVNNRKENFSISTTIEIENINECNAPIISDEYFKDFNITTMEFEIIPIKYSKERRCWVTTEKEDDEWYNYSAKKWAKVIVLSKNMQDLKDKFINTNGTINNTIYFDNKELKIEDFMYVWIPNFSIRDDVTYFRYKASKKAIKLDFDYINGKYLYLNKIREEVKDISEECNFDGLYGVWRKINDYQDSYYQNFNKTKYAPQILEN